MLCDLLSEPTHLISERKIGINMVAYGEEEARETSNKFDEFKKGKIETICNITSARLEHLYYKQQLEVYCELLNISSIVISETELNINILISVKCGCDHHVNLYHFWLI